MQHLYDCYLKEENHYLYNAIRKYGIDCFNIFILDIVESAEDAREAEQNCFDIFLYAQEFIESKGKDKRFHEMSYNINPCASKSMEFTFSDEEKKSLSEKIKDLWKDPEYRAKVLAWRKDAEQVELCSIKWLNSMQNGGFDKMRKSIRKF